MGYSPWGRKESDMTELLTLSPVQEMNEMWVRSLDWEDTLEKGMAIHSSILAWKIPWTEEPGYNPWGCEE